MSETKVKPTSTERILAKMLTENTGRHLLDSGDYYGRHWQHNQGQTVYSYLAQPEATMDWSKHGFGFGINAFHFLRACLEYDAEMNRKFRRFAERKDQADQPWLSNMIAFVEHLTGEKDPNVCNSYNHEDALSQVIQFCLFEYEEEEYVLLQIHGGCDVRGGYTAPRAFRHYDGSGTSLWDFAHGTVWAERPHGTTPDPNLPLPGLEGIPEYWPGTTIRKYDYGPNWSTDDGGYHWYFDGACGREYDKLALQNFPILRFNEAGLAVEVETEEESLPIDVAWELPLDHCRGQAVALEPDGETRRYVCVDVEDQAYCPLTGWLLRVGL